MVFPDMVEIRITREVPELNNPVETLRQELDEGLTSIPAGARIGIAVGSRGIYRLPECISALAGHIRRLGGHPVIVPAMGSHGGATSEGQAEVLRGYGISEEQLGIPVISDVDTVHAGVTTEGADVFVTRTLEYLDGIILFNRIKPHTDFRGPFESGLMKQMAIGLGCHKGAQYIHSHGIENLHWLVPASARVILSRYPVLGGVAVLENLHDRTANIRFVPASRIESEEPELLSEARKLILPLPVQDIDALVIQEMGKNISGVGIDPNVTMRPFIRAGSDWGNKGVRRIVCLELSEETHGNAQGMGIADIITRRFQEAIDYHSTYVNVRTNKRLELAMTPFVAETDLDAIILALESCERRLEPGNERIIQVRNTLDLSGMYLSECLLDEISPELQAQVLRRLSWHFDRDGKLLDLL